MKERPVEFTPEARDDLIDIYNWIRDRAGSGIAIAYVERLETFCRKLSLGSERGSKRDDVREGLRIIGFERRVNVAFVVEDSRVVVLRLFYGGRNWQTQTYWPDNDPNGA